MNSNKHLGLPASAWSITAALLLAACGGSGGGDAPAADGDRASRLAVSRPGELVAYVQSRLRLRDAGSGYGATGATDVAVAPGAAAAAPPRSSTTLQEAGVDEPDLLQSDGNTLYTLQQQASAAQLKVYGRAADGRITPLKDITLPADDATSVSTEGMVLAAGATVLAVLSQRWHQLDKGEPCMDLCPATASLLPVWMRSSVAVQRVDVSDPAAASVGERVSIDGRLVDSRRIGDALYVVTSHLPRLPLDELPASATAAEREAAIAGLTADDLLPRLRRNGGASEPLLSATDCWLQTANGSAAVQFTTITVFDLRSPTLAQRSHCFVGGSEALYMTPASLYLATTRWSYNPVAAVVAYQADIKTDIHKFSLAGGDVVYRASGEVPGHLGWNAELKPYRMSESGADLRVISFTGSLGWATVADATDPAAPPPSPARLTLLRERSTDQSLQPLATLPNARHPDPLGKPGEQLHAVRFVGARAYLVTFRSIDPLYVLDLSDPADPRVAGALEVPGFSDQLFPLTEGLLLGVGRDVTAAGRVGGVKVALFDVRDAARPQQLDSVTLGSAGSATALDFSRHGLNWLTLDGRARIALPVSLANDGGSSWLRGLQRFEVDVRARTLSTLAMLGPLPGPAYAYPWQERSLQIGEQVYHLRDGGLMGYDW